MANTLEREILERELRPRLCYVTKGDRGYGFHLHGDRNRGAQYIRRIEPGSPADLSGLRSGDRVVEVNGENVEGETHQQVVQRILEVEHRTRLLVVDRVTDEFLKFHGLPCTEDRAIEMGSLSSRSSAASSPRASPRDSATPPYSRQSSEGIFINKSQLSLRCVSYIQVNDTSIEGLRHAEVVALIKAGGTETRLLVVDPETDELFNRLGIVPTSIHLKGTFIITRWRVSNHLFQTEDCVDGPVIESPKATYSDHHSSDDARKPERDVKSEDPFRESGLQLSLTAAEAKQKAQAKRPNKRAPPMDWSKKQEIFSNF
uniref:PDZ domain-containing protein n=1 Tax=Cyprinus carpio TaxID=7962 RepID=A0A8C1Y358_CYPCA